MKVIVFDVPADTGGALTILKQYYEVAMNDKINTWCFIISTPELLEADKVKVLRFPWVKKSWFHRLYFDKFVAHKIVKLYQADEVLSLQNVIVEGVTCKQTLYLHQSLPFVEKRYRITEDFKFWVYQNLISRIIFKSIRKADTVIVQTKWMKDVCVEKLRVAPEKFQVIQPNVNVKVKKSYKQENEDNKLFFYPANGLVYKNHKIIVEAAMLLKLQKIVNFRIAFTIKGNENSNVKKLYGDVKRHTLPIDFIGQISLEEVYDYYSKSILIFPSYIETFGLPLLEAKMHGSPILASDCTFSHEILEGYEKVEFFDPFDSEDLSHKIVEILEQSDRNIREQTVELK